MITKHDVLREHIESAKEILKGEWCGFASTELFVELANDGETSALCWKYEVSLQTYIRRVIHTAMREITNSKNWPYWVGVGRAR